jgi:quercetin dioxygenase-like cupin family protein
MVLSYHSDIRIVNCSIKTNTLRSVNPDDILCKLEYHDFLIDYIKEGEVMEKQKITTDSKLIAQIGKLSELVKYQDGSVVSRTLIDKPNGTITLFAFAEGQGLSEHITPYDALVYVFDGETEIIISGTPLNLKAGQTTIMPANKPHALKAITHFKMMLVMIKV